MIFTSIFLALVLLTILAHGRPDTKDGNSPIVLASAWWVYFLSIAFTLTLFGLSVGLFDRLIDAS